MKPLFITDGVVLWNGDALDVMCGLADELVDIVITSPPYNMGLVPGGNGRGMYRPGASNKAGRFRDGYDDSHHDAMPQDDYDAWQRACLAEITDSYAPRCHGTSAQPCYDKSSSGTAAPALT